MTKIALIIPKSLNPKTTYSEYPLGVGYIGTLLDKAGYQVKIFDQNVEFKNNKELVNKLKEYNPSIIGFSVITPTYPTTKDIVNLLKKEGCQSYLISGGIHSTLFPKDLLNDGFDIVIRGEGEKLIVPLVKRIEKGDDISNLPNISYKNKDGFIINNKIKRINTDVNKLPYINRDLYNLSLYSHHSMVGARGCPNNCKFCCNYADVMLNNSFTVRCTKDVIKEIIYIKEKYNAKKIFFVDDIFLLNKSRIINFCDQIIKNDLNIKWVVQLRVDLIDKEVVSKLKHANCEKVYFGIEAGSNKILRTVDKGFTRGKIIQAIKLAKEIGLKVKTGWIYGLPGDIEEQYKSISLMLETRPHEISIHKLIPFPGTEYYNNPKKYGINIKDPKDFANFFYGGLNNNITFDYLTQNEYLKLLRVTIKKLEKAGYISSDKKQDKTDYLYTTPLNKKSINEFKKVANNIE